MWHRNFVQVCVRSELIWLTHTHTAEDKCISLYKQLNATNTARVVEGKHLWPFLSERTSTYTHAHTHTLALSLRNPWQLSDLCFELEVTLPGLYFKSSWSLELFPNVVFRRHMSGIICHFSAKGLVVHVFVYNETAEPTWVLGVTTLCSVWGKCYVLVTN